MSLKEEQRKILCILSGIPYEKPFDRWWNKNYTIVYNLYHNMHHIFIALILWGIAVIVPKRYEDKWFMLFQHWCFNHKVKRK
jgi:hypothetical protein